MRVSKVSIRKYYRGAYTPWLPEGSGWYHFRFIRLDGVMRKVKRRIKTSEDLRNAILALDAGDCYYSTAKYLNPIKVGSKGKRRRPGYVVADQLIIGGDVCFDIDENFSITGLERARKNTIKLINRVKKHPRWGLKDKTKTVQFSGNKGFQVSYQSVDEKLPLDPRKRYLRTLKNRKKYKKRLSGIHFDVATSLNPLLVRRLPGTVNTKTGYIATIITEEQLHLPIRKLLKHIPYVTRGRPGIPTREMTRSPRTRETGLGGVAGLTPPAYLFTPCFTNQVMGCYDRYTLSLEYQRGQRYENDIRFLQKHYKVGTCLVFEHKDQIFIVSPQTFPKARLAKLLDRTCSQNKTLKRIGYQRWPIQKYKFTTILKCNNPLKAASKALTTYLLKYYTYKPWTLEGNDNLKIIMHVKS